MEMIRKTLEFKASDVDLTEGTFQGHASTFGNRDSDGDVIDKGAFKKTLLEHAGRVKILFEHMNVIGKPLEMREDKHGLFVKGKISETSLGKDVLTLMRDGVLNEMSIGFQIVKKAFNKETNTSHIKEVKLWEFSLVPWGANDQALVTGVKRQGVGFVHEVGTKIAPSTITLSINAIDPEKTDWSMIGADLSRTLEKALTHEPPKEDPQDPEQYQSLRKQMDELNQLLK